MSGGWWEVLNETTGAEETRKRDRTVSSFELITVFIVDTLGGGLPPINIGRSFQ